MLGSLGDLPAEIRNEIYMHALTTNQPIEISRMRVRNPNYTGEKERGSRRKELKYLFYCRATARSGRGKRPRRVAAAKALALSLLLTSKVVREEGRPVFFGMNVFYFEGVNALKVAVGEVGSRSAFPLLTRVSVPVLSGAFRPLHGLDHLRRPKCIEIRVGPSNGYPWAKNIGWTRFVAENVGWRIRSLVAFELFFREDGRPDRRALLPEELQLRRLETSRFAVPCWMELDAGGNYPQNRGLVEDE